MHSKINIGIIGGAGYTGGELIRLLINHPQAELVFVHSNSQAGKPVSSVHTDLLGDTDLKFSNSLDKKAELVFLCVGHGEAKKFLAENPFPKNTKIIDLSQDHRLKQSNQHGAWIYGLPELNRETIRKAQFVANPGCFATAIQLALLPLANAGALNSDIHITATTGSTGAGQSLSASSHFSWRQNNLSIYKAFEHQHLGEIGESLAQAQKNFKQEIHFIPQRGSFTRGILAGVYTATNLSSEEIGKIYESYYANHPFVRISKNTIDLKQVVNTNKCILQTEVHKGQVLITSIIDNLLKGASGQAVQNMNLMYGLPEDTGLKLKASVY